MITVPEGQSCRTCRFYAPPKFPFREDGPGSCMRHAPIALERQDVVGLTYPAGTPAWPRVHEGAWCGDWERKAVTDRTHSPEPWRDRGWKTAGFIDDTMGETVAEVDSKEDMRRILACVNACAGIDSEILEAEGFDALLRGVAVLAFTDDPKHEETLQFLRSLGKLP